MLALARRLGLTHPLSGNTSPTSRPKDVRRSEAGAVIRRCEWNSRQLAAVPLKFRLGSRGRSSGELDVFAPAPVAGSTAQDRQVVSGIEQAATL